MQLPRPPTVRQTPNTSAGRRRSRSRSSPARAACRRCRTSSTCALDTARWSFRASDDAGRRPGRRAWPTAALALPLGGILARPRASGPDRDRWASRCRRATSRWWRRSRRQGWTPTTGGQGSSRTPRSALKLFQTNDNWIKVAHTRATRTATRPGRRARTSRSRYEKNGTRTLGHAHGAARARNLPTWWMRRGPQRARRSRPPTRSAIPRGRRTGSRWPARPTSTQVMPPGLPARATSAPTAATARSRPATTTSGFTPDNAGGRERRRSTLAHARPGAPTAPTAGTAPVRR